MRRLRFGHHFVTAAAVILLLASVVVALSAGGSGGAKTNHGASLRSPVPPIAAAGAAAHGSAASGRSSIAVIALSTSPTAATYKVEGGSAFVALSATGHCWVQIRQGTESGPMIFQGILPQTWEGAGALWMRLGNPAVVIIEVNGQPLHPPVSPNTPFDLQIS